MPFLRRRGNMGSETDIRRHSLLDSLAVPAQKQPPPRSESTAELPTLASVAEDLPPPSVPPSPADLPRDSISVASTHAAPSAAEPSDAGPASFAASDDTQKRRRFSMLRFRNASDSQLAAKAKLHAAAEKPPPMPRRTLPLAPPSLALGVVALRSGPRPSRFTLAALTRWNRSSRDHHHCPNLQFHRPPKEALPDELRRAATPVGRDTQDRAGSRSAGSRGGRRRQAERGVQRETPAVDRTSACRLVLRRGAVLDTGAASQQIVRVVEV